MKYLVLALCVCVAAAAPPPWQQTKVFAKAAVRPVVQSAAKAAVTVVQPVARVGTGAEHEAAVLRSESEVTQDGYNYAYETSNGISAQSNGALKKVNNEDFLVSQGTFQYTAPDGTPVQISYTADENGYQPKSDVLPVGPPIPEAILRSIAYIAAHPSAPEITVGRKY